MKHVFITHSNITRIISEGIIRDLGLKIDDVIIISFRNSVIEGYRNINLEAFRSKTVNVLKQNIKTRVLNINQIFKTINTLDQILNFKEDFILYTPQVSDPYYQFVASNRNCRQINFIEEGTASYFPEEGISKVPLLKKISRTFMYKNRLPSCGFFDSSAFKKGNISEYFVFSDGAFKSVANRKLINVYSDQKTIGDNAVLLIIDAIVEFEVGTEKQLMSALDQFIFDNQSENIIYLKFHPQQNQELEQKIISRLNSHFQLIIIDHNVVLEKEFLIERKQKLKVFGIMSSLLIYAKQSGNFTKSYLTFIKDQEQMVENLKNLYQSLGIEVH